MPDASNIPTDFILASDNSVLPKWRPGRGQGAFRPDQYPVLVPVGHRLLEAFIRLHARHVGKRTGSFSMAMICYIEGYVDKDGLLNKDLLSEPCKTFYKELKEGKKSVRQWTTELQAALGQSVDASNNDSG